jgi:CDP-glycerol glycerophosphotransferase
MAALGRARHVVTNVGMPGYYRKPRGTSYLQTWHGTALKRIAFDIGDPKFAGDRRFLTRLERDVARWDALVSPSRFMTEILRRAFRYDGRVLETGYPRNDLLTSPEAPTRRRAVRDSLGLSDSTSVVLYVPTWRDVPTFDLELDVAALGQRFGGDHMFLVRTHPSAQLRSRYPLQPWAIDVAAYPDIRELYLAADVLVTDYSSAMFDFAVTRKPMLFFTYDLTEYRDETRGFYFDFEADAPGPLLATTDEVAAALDDIDAVAARYAPAYDAFFERFCALEDGAATERVISAFFGSKP